MAEGDGNGGRRAEVAETGNGGCPAEVAEVGKGGRLG